MNRSVSIRIPGETPLVVSSPAPMTAIPDATCPTCGSPAVRQPSPVRSWTREAGWSEYSQVRCLDKTRYEIPTRPGAYRSGYGATTVRIGCGLVTVPESVRRVDAADPTTADPTTHNPITKEEQPTMATTMSREQYVEQILAGEITLSEAAAKLGLRDGRSLSPSVVAARKRLGCTKETAIGAKTKTKTIVEKVVSELRRMDAKTFLEQSEPVQQAIRTLLSL